MEPVAVRQAYMTLDHVEVPVEFTLRVENTPGGKNVYICDNQKYELRLLEANHTPAEGKKAKVVFNAQITSKQNGMVVNAPAILITDGEHAGAIMIGSTAEFRKNRALVSRQVGDTVYNTVTMPYPEYMIIETMLKYVNENVAVN